MKNPLALVIAVAIGMFSADASSAIDEPRFPASACSAIDATSAADISYSTLGKAYNNGSVSRTVTCPVPMAYHNTGDTVHVNVYAAQSTACTLRFVHTTGVIHSTDSDTATTPGVSLIGSVNGGWYSANVRCSIPPGGGLISYDVQYVYN